MRECGGRFADGGQALPALDLLDPRRLGLVGARFGCQTSRMFTTELRRQSHDGVLQIADWFVQRGRGQQGIGATAFSVTF